MLSITSCEVTCNQEGMLLNYWMRTTSRARSDNAVCLCWKSWHFLVVLTTGSTLIRSSCVLVKSAYIADLDLTTGRSVDKEAGRSQITNAGQLRVICAIIGNCWPLSNPGMTIAFEGQYWITLRGWIWREMRRRESQQQQQLKHKLKRKEYHHRNSCHSKCTANGQFGCNLSLDPKLQGIAICLLDITCHKLLSLRSVTSKFVSSLQWCNAMITR